MKAFPQILRVVRENEGTDNEYLCIVDDLALAKDRQLVATYELAVVDRLKVTHELTPTRAKTIRTVAGRAV